MKRYLTFAGMDYYPYAGLHGLVGDFDTRIAAINHLELLHDKSTFETDWGQVLDTETGTIIERDFEDDEMWEEVTVRYWQNG